ncbi:MAG: flagellar hook-length control protein FliK [Pseudomonadota bacterium]
MRGQAPDSAGSLRPDPGHPTLSAAKAAKHSQETLPESKSSEGMLHAKTTEISPVAQTKPMPQALAHTTIAAQLMKAQTSTALSTAPESVQGLEEFAWDVRPNGTSPLAHGAPMVQRAEIPQHLSQAIAQVFQRAPDKPVEIALNPIELGRVRLVMTTQETGITITVSAERGDTLELMRRNIDDLGQSLSDLGFEDVSFAFEQHRQGADQRDPAADDTGDLPRIEETLVLHSAKSQINTLSNRLPTGIDMRL